MFGCSIAAISCDSRTKRSRNASSPTSAGASTLSAAFRPRLRCSPRKTNPIPPRPSSRSIRYGPILLPISTAIDISVLSEAARALDRGCVLGPACRPLGRILAQPREHRLGEGRVVPGRRRFLVEVRDSHLEEAAVSEGRLAGYALVDEAAERVDVARRRRRSP